MDLYTFLGIERSMSTAFHPQPDRQTERINQVIEAYVRSHCNDEQNDWAEMLPIAEFTCNNSQHCSTKISPFYANHGYQHKMNLPTKVSFKNPASELFSHYITGVHRTL